MTSRPAYRETATCWHILTVTYGGTVSILKNLDAPSARQAYQRLRPEQWPRKYINVPPPPEPDESGAVLLTGATTFGRAVFDSDIKQVHILGPTGAELDPWRDVEPVVVDLGAKASE